MPLLLYFGYATVGKALEIYSLRQEAGRIRQEVETLKARNALLQQQKGYLEAEGYVERVAREELDLVRPGETSVVVLLPSVEGAGGAGSLQGVEGQDQRPYWRRWWDLFFGD